MRRVMLLGALLALAAGPARADWNASGSFQYQKRLFDHNGFTGTVVNMPVRYAIVQVLDDAQDSVLATGATGPDGSFVVRVPDTAIRRVRVRALSQAADSSPYLLRVQSYAYGGSVYALSSPVTTGHAPSADLDFNSGSPMVAAMFSVGEAFNILDCLENGADYVDHMSGQRPSQLLTANWSTTSTDGTYYYDRNIHLQAEDGYSDTVINHEEGHFMQAMFSHDDTPGGVHYIGDNNQDIRLSLSEGWATYFGLSVRRFMGFEEPEWYVDLLSESAAPGLNFSYELETPNVSAIGAASEVSVQHVLWHIAPGPAGATVTPSYPHIGLPDSVAFDVFRAWFPNLPAGEVTTAESFWDGWLALGKGHASDLAGVLRHVSMEFAPDSFEADDRPSLARPQASDGSPTHHTFYPTGDQDWAIFHADAGITYVVETTGEIGDCATRLDIYGADTTQSLAFDEMRSPGDITSRIDFTAPGTGTYYVRAMHTPAYGRYGSYDLRITQGTPTRAVFTDITQTAGVDFGYNSRGAAWGDYDNDGLPDLYVCNTGALVGAGAANQLFHNDGGGGFSEVAARQGVGAGTEQHEGSAWGDYDNDGNLDLVVTSLEGIHLYHNNGPPGYGFTDVTAAAGIVAGGSGRTACWIDADRDGFLDLYVTNYGFPNQLWHNNGDGTFTLVHLGLDYKGSSFSAAFSDFDRSGRPGVALGLDGEVDTTGLRLFRQGADGQFVDVTHAAGLGGFKGRAFGVAWGDYDGDGWADLAVANEAGLSTLYHNRGDGTFEEVGRAADMQDGLGATSPAWLDVDNDGLQDLYMVNFSGPATLYDNLNGHAFTASGLAGFPGQARAVAPADLDRDGSMDLYVTSQAGNRLYRGQALPGNHWLEAKLRGRASNRAAIGARVEAFAGGRRAFREVVGGQGWGSQPDQTLHFGLGPATVVDSLVVRWPSGIVTTSRLLPVNQRITVDENDSLSSNAQLPRSIALRPNTPNPFNLSTRIGFDLPAGGARVRVAIYDISGRLERVLFDGPRAAGANQSVSWDGLTQGGGRAAAGVYLFRLTVDGRSLTEKMLLLR